MGKGGRKFKDAIDCQRATFKTEIDAASAARARYAPNYGATVRLSKAASP